MVEPFNGRISEVLATPTGSSTPGPSWRRRSSATATCRRPWIIERQSTRSRTGSKTTLSYSPNKCASIPDLTPAHSATVSGQRPFGPRKAHKIRPRTGSSNSTTTHSTLVPVEAELDSVEIIAQTSRTRTINPNSPTSIPTLIYLHIKLEGKSLSFFREKVKFHSTVFPNELHILFRPLSSIFDSVSGCLDILTDTPRGVTSDNHRGG